MRISGNPWKNRCFCWMDSAIGVGEVKLDTGGASRGNPGLAAAGGLIRDEVGERLGAFMNAEGFCSALKAELRGIRLGLKLALFH